MKKILFLLAYSTTLMAAVPDLIPPQEPANITLTETPAWRQYESRLATDRIQRARLCTLELKNRSGKPILIRQLRLRWKPLQDTGSTPVKLHAGFYQLKHDDPAIPDEEQFIASSTWNPAERILTFSFPADTPLKITAVHRYYIVAQFDRADTPLLARSTVVYEPTLPLVTQTNSSE